MRWTAVAHSLTLSPLWLLRLATHVVLDPRFFFFLPRLTLPSPLHGCPAAYCGHGAVFSSPAGTYAGVRRVASHRPRVRRLARAHWGVLCVRAEAAGRIVQPYHEHNAAAQCAEACRQQTRRSCRTVPGFRNLTDTAATQWGADWDRYLTNDPDFPDQPAKACVSGSPPTLTLDGKCTSSWRRRPNRISSRPRMQHDGVKVYHDRHRPRRQHQHLLHAGHFFADTVDGRPCVPGAF